MPLVRTAGKTVTYYTKPCRTVVPSKLPLRRHKVLRGSRPACISSQKKLSLKRPFSSFQAWSGAIVKTLPRLTNSTVEIQFEELPSSDPRAAPRSRPWRRAVVRITLTLLLSGPVSFGPAIVDLSSRFIKDGSASCKVRNCSSFSVDSQ